MENSNNLYFIKASILKLIVIILIICLIMFITYQFDNNRVLKSNFIIDSLNNTTTNQLDSLLDTLPYESY